MPENITLEDRIRFGWSWFSGHFISLILTWIELAFVDGVCSIVVYFLYDYLASQLGWIKLTFIEIYFILYGADLVYHTVK